MIEITFGWEMLLNVRISFSTADISDSFSQTTSFKAYSIEVATSITLWTTPKPPIPSCCWIATNFLPTRIVGSGPNVGESVFIIFCSSTSVVTALSQEHKSFVAQERLQATSLFLRKVQKSLAIKYNFTKWDLCEVHHDITTTWSLVLLKGTFTSASKHQSGLLILLLASRWWKRSRSSYSKEEEKKNWKNDM